MELEKVNKDLGKLFELTFDLEHELELVGYDQQQYE